MPARREGADHLDERANLRRASLRRAEDGRAGPLLWQRRHQSLCQHHAPARCHARARIAREPLRQHRARAIIAHEPLRQHRAQLARATPPGGQGARVPLGPVRREGAAGVAREGALGCLRGGLAAPAVEIVLQIRPRGPGGLLEWRLHGRGGTVDERGRRPSSLAVGCWGRPFAVERGRRLHQQRRQRRRRGEDRPHWLGADHDAERQGPAPVAGVRWGGLRARARQAAERRARQRAARTRARRAGESGKQDARIARGRRARCGGLARLVRCLGRVLPAGDPPGRVHAAPPRPAAGAQAAEALHLPGGLREIHPHAALQHDRLALVLHHIMHDRAVAVAFNVQVKALGQTPVHDGMSFAGLAPTEAVELGDDALGTFHADEIDEGVAKVPALREINW
mmetsp:Transcript_49321/g.137604  ORF Transcript_49321/g.137604 Transcript_49321/m.137604 type:complete len:397 (-) Transcript_49321:522-1712(-)